MSTLPSAAFAKIAIAVSQDSCFPMSARWRTCNRAKQEPDNLRVTDLSPASCKSYYKLLDEQKFTHLISTANNQTKSNR